MGNVDGAPGRRLRHRFGMLHCQRPAIGKMDIECLEWPGGMEPPDLFDGHDAIIEAERSRCIMFPGTCLPGTYP